MQAIGNQRPSMKCTYTYTASSFLISLIHFLLCSIEIAIGGMFSHLPLLTRKSVTASIPYYQDDLIWCVQRAKKIPIFFNFFFIIPVDMWIFFVLISGLLCSTLMYLLVQFDENYRGRNIRIDFFYTLLLIVIPAYSASSSHFHPTNIRLRLIYWMLLTCPMFFQSMIGAFLYQFMKFQFHYHQIASTEEILREDFRLMGSMEVLNSIKHNAMVLNSI